MRNRKEADSYSRQFLSIETAFWRFMVALNRSCEYREPQHQLLKGQFPTKENYQAEPLVKA